MIIFGKAPLLIEKIYRGYDYFCNQAENVNKNKQSKQCFVYLKTQRSKLAINELQIA